MPTAQDYQREIDAKNDALFALFKEAKTADGLDFMRVASMEGDQAARAAEIKRRNDELTDLGKKRDEAAEIERIAKAAEERHDFTHKPATQMVHVGGAPPSQHAAAQKSLEQVIRESKEYKAFLDNGHRGTARFEVPDAKTLITLTTISPQNLRQPDVVAMALEERTVADLMLEGRTDRGTIEYYEETTVTNNAAETAEGSSKPESALAWTLRTETVRKIPTWIPATDEALADVPFLESQIRGRLAFMVRRREETELLVGDGSAPNLRGIVNRSGIQTYALSSEPVPDAIFKGMQLVRGSAGSGFAEPTAVVMNPADWTGIRLLRTADGMYIWGSPADAGPERIWSLPIRQTTAMTENTALVGAFRPYAEVIRRTGIEITVSTEHSTYFIENKVAILAEERIALAVYRPAAFCTVTGI